MFRHNALALILLIGGVLANNYVYLHDLVMNTHDGAIILGTVSYIGVAASLVVAATGLMLILRGPGGR